MTWGLIIICPTELSFVYFDEKIIYFYFYFFGVVNMLGRGGWWVVGDGRREKKSFFFFFRVWERYEWHYLTVGYYLALFHYTISYHHCLCNWLFFSFSSFFFESLLILFFSFFFSYVSIHDLRNLNLEQRTSLRLILLP